MDPADFRYRVADDGRIVVVGLTQEETLEFETLFRRRGDVATELSCELRLLELFLKHHAAVTDKRPIADGPCAERPDADYSREIWSSGSRRARQAARTSQRIHAPRLAVSLGMAGVGMFAIILIAANL